MKICFICTEYPPVPHGGMGTFVQEMGRALVRAGHEVRVTGLYSHGAERPAHEEDEGVRVWRLRMPRYRFGWVAGRYRLYRQVREWVRRGEVDVVDAHDPEGQFAGWPGLPVPLMIRAGGSFSYFQYEMGQPITRSTFLLERSAYRRADGWIGKSRYIGEVTRRVFGLREGPNAVLYNPIQAPETVPDFAGRDRWTVVYTGTLTAKKGVIPLVEAWGKVSRAHPSARLEVYGKDGRSANGGSMQEYLRERLPATARGTVRFHGHVSRAALFEALRRARCAIFPSFSEGFAWAPLESMAAGCPTIYSLLGSGPELIMDGESGLLVDPNAPETLVHALERVLADDGLAARLSAGGRARIEEAFTMEKLLPRNEEFYRQLIGRFQARWNPAPALSLQG